MPMESVQGHFMLQTCNAKEKMRKYASVKFALVMCKTVKRSHTCRIFDCLLPFIRGLRSFGKAAVMRETEREKREVLEKAKPESCFVFLVEGGVFVKLSSLFGALPEEVDQDKAHAFPTRVRCFCCRFRK